MRDGYYSDAYFNHTRAALLHDGRRPRVVMQLFQRKHAMLGGMDEAIAILELCSYDWGRPHRPCAPGRRPGGAVGDGHDDRGRLHDVRAPRDRRGSERSHAGRSSRRTRHASSRRRTASRSSSCRRATTSHRVQTGDGYAASRRRRGARHGDRGHVRRPGILVGRAGSRHRSALADRGVRWQYRPRGHEVRRVGARGLPRITVLVDFDNDSGADGARRRPCARAAALGRPTRARRASSSTGRSGREDGRLRPFAASTSASSARCGRPSTSDGFERVRIVASGGFTVEKIEGVRGGSACRSTPTASARR